MTNFNKNTTDLKLFRVLFDKIHCTADSIRSGLTHFLKFFSPANVGVETVANLKTIFVGKLYIVHINYSAFTANHSDL